MIVKLKGKIDSFSDSYIDVDVKDIVYRVLMTNLNVQYFKEITSEIEVFIYEIIKEDSRTFIGFRNFQEREAKIYYLFRVLGVKWLLISCLI